MKGLRLSILMLALSVTTGCVRYPAYHGYGGAYSSHGGGGAYVVEPDYPLYYNGGRTGVFYNYGYDRFGRWNDGDRYYRDHRQQRRHHFDDHHKPHGDRRDWGQDRQSWHHDRDHRDRDRDHRDHGRDHRERQRWGEWRNDSAKREANQRRQQARERPAVSPHRHNEPRERFFKHSESRPDRRGRSHSEGHDNNNRHGNWGRPDQNDNDQKSRRSGMAERPWRRNTEANGTR
ncbi:MAG: hypothetical protein ACU83N_04040 [Gammaproteobacteria bacterium]